MKMSSPIQTAVTRYGVVNSKTCVHSSRGWSQRNLQIWGLVGFRDVLFYRSQVGCSFLSLACWATFRYMLVSVWIVSCDPSLSEIPLSVCLLGPGNTAFRNQKTWSQVVMAELAASHEDLGL